MIKQLTYQVSDISPYINWLYFYHTWGMTGKPEEAKRKLRDDAEKMLKTWEKKYRCLARFGIFAANSDGDDLLVDGVRIPMLRQQKSNLSEEPNLCLADFIIPMTKGKADKVGIFCTTVEADIRNDYHEDVYERMLSQVLADRLAEGTAEKMHEEVRRKYWGYAPNEQLTMEQTHNEEYQGIRPAVGYPSLPDTSINFLLDELLDMKQVGIRLTESGMMQPHASVSGFMFAHPQSRYFELGKIGEDQLADYATRRGLPLTMVRKFLEMSLLKK